MIREANTTTMELEDLRDFMTMAEVAELFGVSRRTVYSWVTEGLLTTHKDGRKKLIPVAELEVTRLKAMPTAAAPAPTTASGSTTGFALEADPGDDLVQVVEVLGSLGSALIVTATLVEKLSRESEETPTDTHRGLVHHSHRIRRRGPETRSRSTPRNRGRCTTTARVRRGLRAVASTPDIKAAC